MNHYYERNTMFNIRQSVEQFAAQARINRELRPFEKANKAYLKAQEKQMKLLEEYEKLEALKKSAMDISITQ